MENVILCPHCLSRVEEGKQQCPFCEKTLVNSNPPGTLRYASLLADRYTVGKHIATDGEGILYEAVENNSGVKVMLKEYFPVTLSEGRDPEGEILPKEGCEVLFKTTRMDFTDIYRSIMRITPTPGLLTVLDVFEAHNTVYAVMERLSGETLAQQLASNRRCLSPSEARSLLQPIMEGVAAIHKAGLVHRGISPANILIAPSGVARLCGYATIGLRTEGSQLKSQLYEGYSAPEQYSAAEFEGRYTDVYGLAAVFYRLITGQRPESARQRQVKESLAPANRLEPNVPGYIAQVLRSALELDPARRVQNVPELMGALVSPAAAENLMKKNPMQMELPEKESSSISTKSLFAGSLVVILVLFLTVMWLVLKPTEPTKPAPAQPTAEPQQTQVRVIPDVVGISFRQVQNDSGYSDFLFTVSDQRYSSEYKAGVIMEQTPQAGNSTTEQRTTIQVVVSKGPEMVQMPNIIGFPKESAEKELADRHIRASFHVIENDGSYASNSVVNTDVEADKYIDVNETVVNVYVTKDRVIYDPQPQENAEEGTNEAGQANKENQG